MNDKDQTHTNRLYEQHINALTLQGKSERNWRNWGSIRFSHK